MRWGAENLALCFRAKSLEVTSGLHQLDSVRFHFRNSLGFGISVLTDHLPRLKGRTWNRCLAILYIYIKLRNYLYKNLYYKLYICVLAYIKLSVFSKRCNILCDHKTTCKVSMYNEKYVTHTRAHTLILFTVPGLKFPFQCRP